MEDMISESKIRYCKLIEEYLDIANNYDKQKLLFDLFKEIELKGLNIKDCASMSKKLSKDEFQLDFMFHLVNYEINELHKVLQKKIQSSDTLENKVN